jgi:hypothetical protein
VKKKGLVALPQVVGVKASTLFHKDERKRTLAGLASFIAEGHKQGWKMDATFYETAARWGELGTLQKFLSEDDCETITDGKLFNAYKLALAESDELFGELTNAMLAERRRPFRRKGIPIVDRPATKGEAGELVWLIASVHDVASYISKYGRKPPTLASVRYYFCLAFPRNAGLWPNGKDANHDMARKFRKWKLPLTRLKAGRPRNRGKLQK